MVFKKFYVGQLFFCPLGEFCVVTRRQEKKLWVTHGGKIPECYDIWFDTSGGEHITLRVDFERVHHFPPPPGVVEKVNVPPIVNRTHFFHEELVREKIC